MRGLEKGARFLVGRGSVPHRMTQACHSPWHHPTDVVPNPIDSASFSERWENALNGETRKGACRFAIG
jgi:hypothetical protein